MISPPKGYVNLLLSGQMNAKLPGDNKMMVNARTEFLSKGYYSHLAQAVCDAVCVHFHGGVLLDAGCGEGYYTEEIFKAISGNKYGFKLLGIDISKICLRPCGKAAEGSASVRGGGGKHFFHLPLADGSVDMAVTMFAPFCREEFCRVIKSRGYLIMAIPAEDHLMSLKAAVYDKPYKNQTADYEVEGFEFLESRKISRSIFIDNPKDIQSLFSMTPYYYKTGEEGHRRLEALESLETEASFEVLIYKRK
ncbi:MAG: methyltransferase domain-containing protein [Ruminococcus sp.]|nr:MAG: methyltransferase domain-containing protein [Ruminococcus sp.]